MGSFDHCPKFNDPTIESVYLHSTTCPGKCEAITCELYHGLHVDIINWCTSVFLRTLVQKQAVALKGSSSALLFMGEMTHEQSFNLLNTLTLEPDEYDELDDEQYVRLANQRVAEMCLAFNGLGVKSTRGLLLDAEHGHLAPYFTAGINSNFNELVRLHNAVVDPKVNKNVISQYKRGGDLTVCEYNFLAYHLNAVLAINIIATTHMWTSNILVDCLLHAHLCQFPPSTPLMTPAIKSDNVDELDATFTALLTELDLI